MIHFAICDDEPAQVQFLSQLVTNWCAGRGEVCQITCYSSAEALLFAWEEAPLADILLLDILMGQMNGMELARKLRQKHKRYRCQNHEKDSRQSQCFFFHNRIFLYRFLLNALIQRLHSSTVSTLSHLAPLVLI